MSWGGASLAVAGFPVSNDTAVSVFQYIGLVIWIWNMLYWILFVSLFSMRIIMYVPGVRPTLICCVRMRNIFMSSISSRDVSFLCALWFLSVIEIFHAFNIYKYTHYFRARTHINIFHTSNPYITHVQVP